MTDPTPAAPRPVTVFIVDDHAMFRTGVRAELDDRAGTTVVGDAGTVADAVAGVTATRPDVVLLDVHMPDGGGGAVLLRCLDAARARGQEPPRFLGLSVSDAAEDVIALIRAGARGYVTKSIEGDALVDSIIRVHSGDAVFSPRLAGYVLDAFTSGDTADGRPGAQGPGQGPGQVAPGQAGPGQGDDAVTPLGDDADQSMLSVLTPREKEVLRLLARGYTYREMAEKLFISVKTVETHVSNILRKTQQSNRHTLSRWVVDNNLG
ncbi:response regulator transcription factor [Corynebacterium bovis]|uniref:response regulator transcription factor n=1 Tax=Corynebacterium bovis TaxID=36808 RepID=UPI0031390F2A